jgi:IstB-like ATP binding protein
MKSAPLSRRDRLRHILADLRMPGALEALDAILQGVDGGTLTGPEAIEQLLAAQIQLRNNRRLQAAMRSSRLPVVKQLRDFDFTFQPSVRREQIESLHELGFVERRENVIFLGPPGVGSPRPRAAGASTTARSPISSPRWKKPRPPGGCRPASKCSRIRRCSSSTRLAISRSAAPAPCSSSSS